MSNILIVEDDEQLRVLAVSLIEEAGHSATSAANKSEAMALLRTHAPLDLVFADIGLQGELQGGLNLATEAGRIRPGIPVLYTSGQALTDGMEAMFVEKSVFLAKPYTVDQLKTALADALKAT
jgi:DNA-binding NtrC family response regulator